MITNPNVLAVALPLQVVARALPLAPRTLHNLHSLGRLPWLRRGRDGEPTRRLVVDWPAARAWWAARGVDIDTLATQRLAATTAALLPGIPKK